MLIDHRVQDPGDILLASRGVNWRIYFPFENGRTVLTFYTGLLMTARLQGRSVRWHATSKSSTTPPELLVGGQDVGEIVIGGGIRRCGKVNT